MAISQGSLGSPPATEGVRAIERLPWRRQGQGYKLARQIGSRRLLSSRQHDRDRDHIRCDNLPHHHLDRQHIGRRDYRQHSRGIIFAHPLLLLPLRADPTNVRNVRCQCCSRPARPGTSRLPEPYRLPERACLFARCSTKWPPPAPDSRLCRRSRQWCGWLPTSSKQKY